MDNFVVSARKYRPSEFDSVVGQSHITTTLKNAIKSGHLAQAFLFCGPRGVGKTTCARILAKTINCENLSPEVEPCNACASCTAFNAQGALNITELDAASNNSVEDIRNLIEQVRYPPQHGKRKVYIIDEVHMLSNQAFNAFLKTLEEPPAYAIFILATTEKHKIIPTILSRCQIFDFNRIQVKDIAVQLQYIASREGIEAEPDALHLIAQKADGALRDALSIFDLMVTFAPDRILRYKSVVQNLHVLDHDYYFRLTDSFLAEDRSAVMLLFDDVLRLGFDAQNFLIGLSDHFRNLLMCKESATVHLLEVSDGVRASYIQQCKMLSASFLLSAMSLTNDCEQQYKSSKHQRFLVEICLLKITHLPSAFQVRNSIEELKKKVELSTHSTPSTPAQKAPNSSANTEGAALKSTGGKLLKPGDYSEILKSLPDKPSTIAEPIEAPPLSPENLCRLWEEFMKENNTSPGAMNFVPPFNVESPQSVIIELKSLGEENVYNQHKNKLLPAFRNKFRLPKLELRIEIKAQAPIQTARPYTQTDKINFLSDKYPDFKAFIDRFDLKGE